VALALYRKYRPATFAEVVGQDHVTQPLQTSLAAGRINHAYLFSGPRGCGKTSSARIMARSLNCVQGPTPDPCGVCTSCVALAPEGAGSIDVVELDAASHGGVDDTRELRDRAFYMPAESRYRIFIIDEAHMVSAQGFNALLKIVEEPPEHIVFIFATTEPDKVMTTIRSRTHHYPFRLIPPATLRKLLERLCAEEGVHVEPAVFPLVIQAGGGSARDSLSILDQLLSGAGPEGVTYRSAVALLGVTDVALLDEAVDALAANDGGSVFGAVDKVVEAGHDPRRFASDLLQRFRDLVILAAVPDAAVSKGLIDAPEDQVAAMTTQATRFGPATLTRIADILHTGLTDMRGTTAPRLALELMCARMLLPAASTDEAALIQRLERLERGVPGVSGMAAATPGTASTAPPAAPRAGRDSGRATSSPSAGEAARGSKAAGTSDGAPLASSPPGKGPERVADQEAGAAEPARPEAGGRGTYRRPSRGEQPAAASTAPAAVTTASKPGGLGLPPPPVLSSASRRSTSSAQPPAAVATGAPPTAQPQPAAAATDAPPTAQPQPAAAATDAPPTAAPGAEQQQPPAVISRPTNAEPAPQGGPPAGAGSRSDPDQPRTATGKPASDGDYVPPDAPPPDPDLEPPIDEFDDAPPPASLAALSSAGQGAAIGGAAPTPAAHVPEIRPAAAPAPARDAPPSGTPQGGSAPRQPAAPPARAGEKGQIDVTDIRRVWTEVLAVVYRDSRARHALLDQHATVGALANGVLTLTVASPGLARRVSDAGNIQFLRAAIKEVLSVDIAVRVEPGAAAGAARSVVTVLPAAAEPSDFDPGDEPSDEPPFDRTDTKERTPPAVRHPDQLAVDLLVQHVGAKRVDPV
jgi:DNA polymerase III subunit gamma/tau